MKIFRARLGRSGWVLLAVPVGICVALAADVAGELAVPLTAPKIMPV